LGGYPILARIKNLDRKGFALVEEEKVRARQGHKHINDIVDGKGEHA
jgi:RNA:NAD 2'-phosphotransferase (TPT1/KptA family)